MEQIFSRKQFFSFLPVVCPLTLEAESILRWYFDCNWMKSVRILLGSTKQLMKRVGFFSPKKSQAFLFPADENGLSYGKEPWEKRGEKASGKREGRGISRFSSPSLASLAFRNGQSFGFSFRGFFWSRWRNGICGWGKREKAGELQKSRAAEREREGKNPRVKLRQARRLTFPRFPRHV